MTLLLQWTAEEGNSFKSMKIKEEDTFHSPSRRFKILLCQKKISQTTRRYVGTVSPFLIAVILFECASRAHELPFVVSQHCCLLWPYFCLRILLSYGNRTFPSYVNLGKITVMTLHGSACQSDRLGALPWNERHGLLRWGGSSRVYFASLSPH